MVINERHNVAFLVGILIGAIASSVAALLLTPLSGRETRQQLAARIDEVRGTDATGSASGVKRISSTGDQPGGGAS